MTPRLQNALIFLGIISIAGLGYYLYVQKDGSSLNNSLVDNQAAAETAEFLQRLNDLKTIKLEGKIFKDDRFTSLQDLSQPVVPVPMGRTNPFTSDN
jgi:hypothetical protein